LLFGQRAANVLGRDEARAEATPTNEMSDAYRPWAVFPHSHRVCRCWMSHGIAPKKKGSVLAELEAEDSEDHNSLQDDARARWWVYACVSQSSVDARTTIPERLATCDTLQRLTGSNLVCPSAAVSVASN
jgi:hypothetical protein